MENMANSQENHTIEYEELEKTIRKTLRQTIGKQKIRTDKPPKTSITSHNKGP